MNLKSTSYIVLEFDLRLYWRDKKKNTVLSAGELWGQRLLFLITTNHSHVCSQANTDWQLLLWRMLFPVSNLTVFSRNIHLSFSVLVYISCVSCIYFYNMVRNLGEHLRIYSWYWQLQQIRGGILLTFFRLHSCWGYLEDKNIDFVFHTV